LLESGYIGETGSGESSGGRRPTLLSIRPGLGRLIGIHIGTVNVRIALTDIAGTPIEYLELEAMVRISLIGPDEFQVAMCPADKMPGSITPKEYSCWWEGRPPVTLQQSAGIRAHAQPTALVCFRVNDQGDEIQEASARTVQ
jgi:hypothetical protein